jgi:microcompartment protein CcmK/EutM
MNAMKNTSERSHIRIANHRVRRAGLAAWVATLVGLGSVLSLQATLLDNFSGTKTGWTDTQNGGTVSQLNGSFTVTSSASPGALTSSKKTTFNFVNAVGHTIELRVNVASINPGGAANGHAVLGWVPSGALASSGYYLRVGTNDITLARVGGASYTTNLVTAITNKNLLLVLRMTTTGGGVDARGSVYNAAGGAGSLLFEYTISDAGTTGTGNAALGAWNQPSGAAASAVFDDLKGFDILNADFAYDFSLARLPEIPAGGGVYVKADGWYDYRPNGTGATIENTSAAGKLTFTMPFINATYVAATYYPSKTFKIADGTRLEYEMDITASSGNPVIIPLLSYLPNGLPDLASLATYFLGDSDTTVVAGKNAAAFWTYDVGTSTVPASNVRLYMAMSGEGTSVRIEQRIEDKSKAVNDPARVAYTTSFLDASASYINKNGYLSVVVYAANTATASGACSVDNVQVNQTAPGNTPPIIGSPTPGNGTTFYAATNTVAHTTNSVTFQVSDDSNIPAANIVLTLNGVPYTSASLGVSVTGNNTLRTFILSNLTANVFYKGNITATDNQGASSTIPYSFDTFLTNTTDIVVECEDYNYSTDTVVGGVFLDNPVLYAEGTGPFANGYNGQSGIQDIDFHDSDSAGALGDANHAYRPDNPRTYTTSDGPRAKYVAAGGAGAGFNEIIVSANGNADWMNYSRTFAAGTYNVFIREGSYGGTAADMPYSLATLERVLTDPTLTNTTTRGLGSFFQLSDLAGDTGFGVLRDVALTDASGSNAVVRMTAGVNTVRFADQYVNFHSDTFLNYMVFVPVADPGVLRPVVTRTSPAYGSSTRVDPMPTNTFATIARRDTTVNLGTVVFKMNGVTVVPPAVVTDDLDGGATVTWSLTNTPPTRVITNTVTFNDSDGVPVSYSWTYSYPFLSATNSVPLGSLPARGFAYRMAQDDAASGDSLIRAEEQLSIPPGIISSKNWATNVDVLDWNDDTGVPNWTPGLDGIPAPVGSGYGTGPYDYIATEALAYLELKAGAYRFVVSSDDGFELRSGHTPSDLNATILCRADGNTFSGSFDFVVEADGLYPVRNLWYEQTGGAHFSLSSYNFGASTNVVVNDPLNPAGVVKAYLSVDVELWSSSAPDTGYLYDATATVNVVAKTITVPRTGATRYYRIFAPSAVTIKTVVRSGLNIVLTYQ